MFYNNFEYSDYRKNIYKSIECNGDKPRKDLVDLVKPSNLQEDLQNVL